jgi:hypothetical protein
LERKVETGIGILEPLLGQALEGESASEERWDPPYCGDIGLEIGPDGTWSYQASPIRRPELVKLFARVLRREADGRHFLVTPAERVDVRVWDAPFLAVELQAEGHGPEQLLTFRTNVDDIVACCGSHPLRFVGQPGGGAKPYLLVRGRLEALVARSVYYDLVELAVERRDACRGDVGIWSGGAFFPLPGS